MKKELQERAARALAERNGSLEAWENYPPGTAYRDVFDSDAEAVLAAFGLDDLDAAAARMREVLEDPARAVALGVPRSEYATR